VSEFNTNYVRINVDRLGDELALQPEKLAEVAEAFGMAVGNFKAAEYNYKRARAQFRQATRDLQDPNYKKVTDKDLEDLVYLDPELNRMKGVEIQAQADMEHLERFYEAVRSRDTALPNLRRIDERKGGSER
jgi:Sec-independent protein translocase protein TatA